MSNPNKDRGSRWERALATYFQESGFPEVDRIRGKGLRDVGDLGGLRSFVIEAKDWARPNFPEFIRQAKTEAQNAGKPFGVAIQKKRRAPVGDALVLMDLDSFLRLLQYIETLGGRP